MSETPRHPKWKDDYKKDVVYLHVIPRTNARFVVNISPYAIKLELWLRINQIPFETIDSADFSRKGQSPYILFNGEEIPDSNFTVEYLSKYFNKDPYPGLSAVQRATARAFLKMVEEETSWPIFIYRYVEHTDEYADYFYTDKPLEVRKQVLRMLSESTTIEKEKLWVSELERSVTKQFATEGLNQVLGCTNLTLPPQVGKRAHGHGIGRHDSKEIQKIGCDDVQAISDFLGEKQYMMGDQPTLVDCSVFGVLSQVVYVPMGYPMRKYIQEKCPNIISLCDRLKNTYWSNWDEQTVK